MREEEAAVAIVMFLSIAGAISIKVIVSAWLRHHENKMKYMNAPPDLEVAARLERIEQAMDSIAIEVERISENQRFTTKLLAERDDRARLTS